MKTELEEIKKELESTLEGFKDAYENYGYDLANEKYYIETALKKVNLLLLHSFSSSLPNVYEEPYNSARIKFYKHLATTMNVSEYATRHIFNEACDWYKTLT